MGSSTNLFARLGGAAPLSGLQRKNLIDSWPGALLARRRATAVDARAAFERSDVDRAVQRRVGVALGVAERAAAVAGPGASVDGGAGGRLEVVQAHPVPEAREDLLAGLEVHVGRLDGRVVRRLVRVLGIGLVLRRERREVGQELGIALGVELRAPLAERGVETPDLQPCVVAPISSSVPSPLTSASWIVEYLEGSVQPPASVQLGTANAGPQGPKSSSEGQSAAATAGASRHAEAASDAAMDSRGATRIRRV